MLGQLDFSFGDVGSDIGNIASDVTPNISLSDIVGTSDGSVTPQTPSPDYSGILNWSLPDVFNTGAAGTSGTVPVDSYHSVNPPAASSDGIFGMSYSDIQSASNAINQLAKIGTTAYATVQAINHGNPSQYAYPMSAPTGGAASAGELASGQYPTLPPATATPFFGSLTDFSQPTPYVVIGGVLLLLTMVAMKKKSRK